VNIEIKEPSKQWMDTHSPNKPEKFTYTFADGNFFWDRRGVLMEEFTQQGTTITSHVH
jgi:hypothetical protein